MNILFIGKPGSGKGTITQQLIQEGFLQLSTGDLLRSEVETGSQLGQEIDALLKKGQFATDDTIFTIVNNFLETNKDSSIIFDGFPRNLKQAQTCLDNGLVFDKVFLIDIPDEAIKERIVNRRVHLNSGRVYNIKSRPPINAGFDDITGEALTHRNDDQENVLEQRLTNYQEKTAPIADFLLKNGYEITTINGQAPLDEQIASVKKELGLMNSTKKNRP